MTSPRISSGSFRRPRPRGGPLRRRRYRASRLRGSTAPTRRGRRQLPVMPGKLADHEPDELLVPFENRCGSDPFVHKQRALPGSARRFPAHDSVPGEQPEDIVRFDVRERMPRRSSAATIITFSRSDDDPTIAPEAIAASRSERCAPGVRSPIPHNDSAKSWDYVANRRHTVVATAQALDAAELMFWLMRRRLRSSLREITVGAADASPVGRRRPTSGVEARFFRTCFDVPKQRESERPEKNSRPTRSFLATRVPKTRYVHYS